MEEYLVKNNCHYLNFDERKLDDMLKLLVIMYADDTVIMADSEKGLCNAIKSMETYCDKWELKNNCNKTKITSFTKEKHD